jgi:hypothetical protein
MVRSAKRTIPGSGFATAVLLAIVLYVASSGPVLAAAFWLREATNLDQFYLVMWAYYPLLVWGPDAWPVAYVEWWCEALGTVGPG